MCWAPDKHACMSTDCSRRALACCAHYSYESTDVSCIHAGHQISLKSLRVIVPSVVGSSWRVVWGPGTIAGKAGVDPVDTVPHAGRSGLWVWRCAHRACSLQCLSSACSSMTALLCGCAVSHPHIIAFRAFDSEPFRLIPARPAPWLRTRDHSITPE